MIKRIYKTKDDCVDYFMEHEFDCFPSEVLSYPYDDFSYWGYTDGVCEDEEVELEEYDYVDIPMWNTWFIPSRYVEEFIAMHPETVADCGFTIIYDSFDNVFALGVDGAGYSFHDAHFKPLYDAMGLKWHDE